MFLPPYVPGSSAEAQQQTASDVDGQFMLVEEGFLLKTSALTEQGTRSVFNKGILYTVEDGDNLTLIAKNNGISTDTIRWANGLTEKDQVQPGQKLLLLPVDGLLHTVKRGQNLSSIAELYDVPMSLITQQNNIEGGYLLAGQELIIPGGKPIIQTTKILVDLPPGTFTLPDEQVPTATTKPSSVKVAVKAVTPPPEHIIAPPTKGILQMPCDCFYTQYFNGGHFGVDLQHRGGSPVFAAEAGTVIRADTGWNGGYGNVIEIDHGNGLVTLYGHNKELYVKNGDTVKRGQAISFMGNTGLVHGPTGIHLHFEVRMNGVKKNPQTYLDE